MRSASRTLGWKKAAGKLATTSEFVLTGTEDELDNGGVEGTEMTRLEVEDTIVDVVEAGWSVVVVKEDELQQKFRGLLHFIITQHSLPNLERWESNDALPIRGGRAIQAKDKA